MRRNKNLRVTLPLLAVLMSGAAFAAYSVGQVSNLPSPPAQDTKPTIDSPNRTSVMVQDFEKVAITPPTVWVVNIPNENASVQLSTEDPHEGKQCLKLHYRFVVEGQFQYLGIPNKVRIQAPVHALHYGIRGDDSKCSYGVQVSDASGETHQSATATTLRSAGTRPHRSPGSSPSSS